MFKKFLLAISLVFIIGTSFVAGVFLYFSWNLPNLNKLKEYHPPISTKILSKDNVVLAELQLQRREIVDINTVPQRILDAFTSAEDANFYKHHGVDYLGIARAMIANIRAGRIVQGGSTITQQVAKSLLLTSERSYSRKIKDFLLALKIEKHFTKKEILNFYVNQVYLGGGYYGIKASFKGYFNKELKDVTVAEAAMLAGLLVAPGKYSPYLNHKRAKMRQEYVLGRMFANGKISKDVYQDALKTKLIFMIRKPNLFKAPYFTDWILQKLIKKFGKKSLLRDGYIIKTTLNMKLQKKAEEAVRHNLENADMRQGFKGAIKHVNLDDFYSMIRKERNQFLNKKSNFFTLSIDNSEKKYEFNVDDDFLENLKTENDMFLNEIRNKHFLMGNIIGDKIVPLLEQDKFYKATVLKADRSLRIIYVSIMGVKGIIPYKYYRWAHKRHITGKREYFPWIKNPREILKEGDQVYVKIKNMSVSIKSYFYKNFKVYFDKMPDKKKLLISQQQYLLVSLSQKPSLQGGLISMDPRSGEIKSLVGGYSYKDSKYNRAIQARRQPGSAFKPFLYAAALENGFTPASLILDSPEALQGVSSMFQWKPHNYDNLFKGQVSLRESLEHSRNVPTIKMVSDLGVNKIVDFLERIKFHADLNKDLSIALGTFVVTLKDIVKAYCIFPNGGNIVDEKYILSITDRDGNTYNLETIEPAEDSPALISSEKLLSKNEENVDETIDVNKIVEEPKINPFITSLAGKHVYDSRLAYLMSNLLKGVIQHGTGRRVANISSYIGGKTGTTNNYVDAWFLGFSNKLVTGVWSGFDDNTSMGWGETGSKTALPAWGEYMKYSIELLGDQDFKIPDGIINVKINKKTGKLTDKNGPDTMVESFVEGTEPGTQETLFDGIKKDKNTSDEDLYFED